MPDGEPNEPATPSLPDGGQQPSAVRQPTNEQRLKAAAAEIVSRHPRPSISEIAALHGFDPSSLREAVRQEVARRERGELIEASIVGFGYLIAVFLPLIAISVAFYRVSPAALSSQDPIPLLELKNPSEHPLLFGQGGAWLGLFLLPAALSILYWSWQPGRKKAPLLRYAILLWSLVLAFSATYWSISLNSRGSFNPPLNRTQAVYFTLTTFTTTGFGDITPASDAARRIVSLQMATAFIYFVGGLAVVSGRRTGSRPSR